MAKRHVSAFTEIFVDFGADSCYEEGMSLKTTIEDRARHALKNQEEALLSTLRMLLAAIHNREIEKRTKLSKGGDIEDLGKASELTDEEVLEVIRTEVKKRRDSIEGFEQGGRTELAEKEKKELTILQTYLPVELSDEGLAHAVRDVVGSLGAVTQKDFGRVMGEVMKKVKGQASGDRISRVVRESLGA